MKKIFNLIAIAAVFGSALAGCNVLTEDGVYAGKKEINFSATVGTYQVKATDTAFEDGDAIGLFADDPIYVENVKLNFSKGKLTPEAPVYWGEQQLLEQPTYFSAYYPYVTNSAFVDKEYGYRSIYFAVAEDQTTHEAMTASDFMVAKAQSSPADGTVQLHFAHAFSKIIFTVDNQINDNKVVNITLGGVCLGAWAHVEDIGASWGDYDRQGTIKMAPVTTAAGEPAWAAILPPQSVYPVVFIEMEDGDQYTYNTDEEVYFGPSRRYNASIVIDQTSVSADFSSDISDWVDSGEIPFGQYVDAGNWYCQTSSDVYWMEHDGKAVRHADINYYSGSVLHFVKELENWETEHYGLAEENITVEEGYTYQIVKNGNEFSLPMEGYWRLTIVPEQGTLVAEYRGAFENWNEGWSLIGTIYDTYWDTDFSMEQYGDFAVFTLDYVEGQEF
ncbi:MAG: fimbrillin family protein, partial [Bacteroidales bacterium]|nr:fimbrillin family protein [Bacteroidales bacterium]